MWGGTWGDLWHTELGFQDIWGQRDGGEALGFLRSGLLGIWDPDHALEAGVKGVWR